MFQFLPQPYQLGEEFTNRECSLLEPKQLLLDLGNAHEIPLCKPFMEIFPNITNILNSIDTFGYGW